VGAGCDFVERNERGSAWAIGLDIPVVGYGQHEGAIVPGFGLEAALHLHPMFDFLVHGDIVVMPRGDDERALHQTVLAGGRIDFSHHPQPGDVKGVFATLGAGYDRVAAPSSAAVQSGPIVEGSVAWGLQGSDGAAWLRLHGRFGVGPDNSDLRAVFLSLGMEIRLDRNRWRDRN
ncbi:MAG TPA: hypothetical protein VFV99_16390, partial [Kofleriaceae bacterium]|nr:hypothetical protein [Kofleriaceae bacterium]